MKARKLISIGAAGIFVLAWVADAGATTEWEQLTASDGGMNDSFGSSVGNYDYDAEVGPFFIVGAPEWDDGVKTQTGAAYVYYYDPGGPSWDEELLYDSASQAAGDGCGTSVAIYKNYAIVGCPYADKSSPIGPISNAGRVYIYELTTSPNTWTLNNSFYSPNAIANGYYGWSVSISEEWAIVGAPLEDTVTGLLDIGRAYVYHERAGAWSYDDTLGSSSPEPYDLFGYSVGVSPSPVDEDVWAIAGSPGYYEANFKGIGWVWKYNTGTSDWDLEDSLKAGDAAAGDCLGISASISTEGGAILGAPYENEAGNNAGAAYVFERSTGPISWDQVAKLSSSAYLDPGDYFGTSVAIYGYDKVIVGAFQDDEKGNNSGAAYTFVYENSQWEFDDKYLADDGDDGHYLGWSVSISEDYAFAGAKGWTCPNDDPACGAAYIYE